MGFRAKILPIGWPYRWRALGTSTPSPDTTGGTSDTHASSGGHPLSLIPEISTGSPHTHTPRVSEQSRQRSLSRAKYTDQI